MRTPLLLAAAALAATTVTTTLVLGQPKTAPQTPAPPSAAAPANAQVERGRYLTQLGDCVACHTQQGGQRFAGGRPLETPFGTLLSANITPDKDTGIGGWSADQFWRAMHEGIDDQGHHLYPAFPYNYYTQVTREDSDAMFAYLRTLPAVHKQFERNKLPFPFNIRALMIGWNLLFLHKGPYQPDTTKSAEWNRGAYLVEGLGHCEACHTPMNLLGAPKHDQAFRGGAFGEWFAPDITANQRTGIGGWDDNALREFLRRGLSVHSAASGEMGEVVAFSTSQMSDADLNAVIAYLRGVPASPQPRMEVADAGVMKQGGAIWQDNCAACHRVDGDGVPRYFPPLQHNPNVQQSDPTTVVHFVLAGTRHVPVDKAPTPLSMPAFYWKLDDQQVAAVATYVRNSWGNSAPAVKPDDVTKLRAKLELGRQQESAPPRDLKHAGPDTRAPAGTDSRDNGTPRAGREVPAGLQLPTSAASAPGAPAASGGGASRSGSDAGGASKPAGGGNSKQQEKGHPAGVPTGGPG